MVQIRQIRSFRVAALALVAGLAMSSSIATPAVAATNYSASADAAHEWLKSRQVATGLVVSLEDRQDICYTYDQAVAASAFILEGDLTNAKRVLDRLQAMQYADGSWNTAYYCKTLGVQESQKHVGPVLWVAMAVAHYEKVTNDKTTYRAMAIKAVDWSLQFQQADGALNLGLDFDGSLRTEASTEHNQDAYVTLKYFGYTTKAAEVKSWLDNVAWAGDHWIGGRNDTRDPLDTNSWGVSAFGATGTHNYQISLDYVMNNHRNTQTSRSGRITTSYDAFDFNSDKNDIWFEGTGQMVVAFQVVGRNADADYFMNQLIKGQAANGGVPYSLLGTDNGYWRMSKNNAVSSTGWLIFAAHKHNPFNL